MREYKFRGYSKRALTTPTQWICDGYGVSKIDYTNGTSSVHLITPYGDYWVEEDSVGQYTEFKDKNGNEIYEGDILKCSSMLYPDIVHVGVVKYRKGEFKVTWIKEDMWAREDIRFWVEDRITEVVGNIYEDREILEILDC